MKQGKQCLAEGDEAAAEKHFMRAFPVTTHMNRRFIEVMLSHGSQSL